MDKKEHSIYFNQLEPIHGETWNKNDELFNELQKRGFYCVKIGQGNDGITYPDYLIVSSVEPISFSVPEQDTSNLKNHL